MEQVEATVQSTIYRNPENGYSVVSVLAGSREYTVVGALPMLSPGEQVLFSGEWVEHSRYGRQLRCEACELRKPTTLLGIERYLGSGMIRGVGPSMAKQIVSHFGQETLTVLSEHPERLQEVRGIGRKSWKMIAESYASQVAEREAMVFLQSYGISAALAVRIAKQYGDRARTVIQTDPYQLCTDLEGVGFLTADRIGIAMGVPADSEGRVSAALRYLLQDAGISQGHVYLPRAELIDRAAALLRVDESLCQRQVDSLALERKLVRRTAPDGSERIYLPWMERAEKDVAAHLCDLMGALGHQAQTGVDMAIDQFEASRHITFSQHQRQAITAAMENGVLVITGGPGTGKTTIINCIIRLLRQFGEVLLCAPTGRAAKRMSEATGLESRTIHRLLEFDGESGEFARNAENPLETECVVVDEMSMVDLQLMRSLLLAIAPGTRLIMVGDSDQLPSVGAGNVLGDILLSGVVPAVRLTDIFRQSETSRIVVNAHRINHGELPLLNEKGTDFFFERSPNPTQAAATVVQLVSQRLPGFIRCQAAERSRMIQVLTPARKGECGVLTLNTMLQEVLNPPDSRKPAIVWNDMVFRLGDKVMQTRNDYELAWRMTDARGEEEGTGVFNGDVGYITDVDTDASTMDVLFEDGRLVTYGTGDLENLELAYCLTVHKSQGSEFPVVVMPVVSGPPMLQTRNLFYTALTRAKQLVVLVGQEEIIERMVHNDRILSRYTALAERLQATAAVMLA